MKKTITIALVSVLFLCVLYATFTAQQAPATQQPNPAQSTGLKIGIVTLKEAIDKYEFVIDEKKKIEEEMDKYQKELNELKETIQKKTDDLANIQPGTELYERKKNEILQLQMTHYVKANLYKQTSDGRKRQFMFESYTRIMSAISEVAKAGTYDLVLKIDYMNLNDPKISDEDRQKIMEQEILLRTVAYHSRSIDITDMVVKKLNEDYKEEKKKNPPK